MGTLAVNWRIFGVILRQSLGSIFARSVFLLVSRRCSRRRRPWLERASRENPTWCCFVSTLFHVNCDPACHNSLAKCARDKDTAAQSGIRGLWSPFREWFRQLQVMDTSYFFFFLVKHFGFERFPNVSNWGRATSSRCCVA